MPVRHVPFCGQYDPSGTFNEQTTPVAFGTGVHSPVNVLHTLAEMHAESPTMHALAGPGTHSLVVGSHG